MQVKQTVLLGAIGLSTLLLVGCATNISTKTLATPQLAIPAQASGGKAVYVQIRNLTTQDVSGLQASLSQALQKSGYTLANDEVSANQVIHVDVLQAGKSTMTALKTAMAAGVGGVITNAPQSLALVPADSNVRVSITNAESQNLTYSLMTDVTYSFKISSNTSRIQQQGVAIPKGGTSATSFNVTQMNWDNYSNRVIAYAVKANIPFNQAMTTLTNDLVAQVVATLPR